MRLRGEGAEWLERHAGMTGETLHADLRVEHAIRCAGGAEDLVVVGATESDVADDLRGHVELTEDLAFRAEHGDAALLRLGPVEVSNPQVARCIERAAIAAAAAEVVEYFRRAERRGVIRGQREAEDLLRLRLDEIQEAAGRVHFEAVGKREAAGDARDLAGRVQAVDVPDGLGERGAFGVGPIDVAARIDGDVVEAPQRLALELVREDGHDAVRGEGEDRLVLIVHDEDLAVAAQVGAGGIDVEPGKDLAARVHFQKRAGAEIDFAIEPRRAFGVAGGFRVMRPLGTGE